MQINHDIIVTTAFILDQARFWIPCIGFGWGLYKAFAWVKAIREKDLAELKVSMDGVKTGLEATNTAISRMEQTSTENFKSQTTSIVDQLKELRSDFRTFYTIPQPQMLPARAKSVKSRKQTAK